MIKLDDSRGDEEARFIDALTDSVMRCDRFGIYKIGEFRIKSHIYGWALFKEYSLTIKHKSRSIFRYTSYTHSNDSVFSRDHVFELKRALEIMNTAIDLAFDNEKRLEREADEQMRIIEELS